MKHFHSRAGQSLVEVVIGLAIGAILMGTAAFAVTTMLRTNLTSERSQFASAFAQSLADNVRSFASSNWKNLFDLTKGTGSHYFLNASGTTFAIVQGEEGMLDGDVPDGLVGQWKFDEIETTTSTLTYDATGNGNHGTLTNSPTRASSTCRISNCLAFNGTSTYVGLPNEGFFGSGQQTLALWARANTSTPSDRGFLFSHAASLNNRVYIIQQTGGNIQFQGGNLSFYTIASSSQYSAGEWFHVVIVRDYDAQQLSAWVNGVQTLSGQSATWESTTSVAPQIGAISGTESFDGAIDDVRIYNRALSADEVTQLYKSGIYERFFTIENVCRTNDASSTISGKAPCGSGVEDISTQWLTSTVQWTAGSGTSEVTLPVIVTRSRNAVFHQTDWSGGASNEGAIAAPTSKFSSSTNASTTGGKLQIQNLSQE